MFDTVVVIGIVTPIALLIGLFAYYIHDEFHRGWKGDDW